MRTLAVIVTAFLVSCTDPTAPEIKEDESFTYNKYTIGANQASSWRVTLTTRENTQKIELGNGGDVYFGKYIILEKLDNEGGTVSIRKDIRREWPDGTWFDTIIDTQYISSTNEVIKL